jgi:hypothetical protein
MNERIQQLAEQVYGSAHHDDFKFAELIVEECAMVIEKNLFQGIGWNTSRAVKRHFGIGEEE